MAVDYEEGRRLLAALDAAFELGETPDRVRAKDDMVGWLLFHAEALLNPDPWRGIETAATGPGDIEEVLLYSGVKNMVWIGYHSHDRETRKPGWVISQLGQPATFCPWQPTHWKPLPAPPTHFRELKGPGHA